MRAARAVRSPYAPHRRSDLYAQRQRQRKLDRSHTRNTFFVFAGPQKKIDEAETKRRGYEEERDTLKTKIHGLNSLEFKVCVRPPARGGFIYLLIYFGSAGGRAGRPAGERVQAYLPIHILSMTYWRF